VVEAAMKGLNSPHQMSETSEYELMKQEANRLVFRLNCDVGPDKKSVVVKVFPLQCLRHRLKYHSMKRAHSRFAYGEAVGLMLAAKHGLKVPKVYGYGQVYDGSLLIKKSVLIMEDLSRHSALGDLLIKHADDQMQCGQLLDRAIPFLIRLSEHGINHISVNVGAIMLASDPSDEDYIIDFEYAHFYGKPSYDLLAYEAAFLANDSRATVKETVLDAWMGRLVAAAGIQDKNDVKHILDQYRYYRDSRLSRKEREKIGASA
jgi:hypothetical protein